MEQSEAVVLPCVQPRVLVQKQPAFYMEKKFLKKFNGLIIIHPMYINIRQFLMQIGEGKKQNETVIINLTAI